MENKKITLKEFWESPYDLAIHCDTEKKANKLCKAFGKMGIKWVNGVSYTDVNNWHIYKKDTCYANRREYSNLVFYLDMDYTVYEFEDVILEI